MMLAPRSAHRPRRAAALALLLLGLLAGSARAQHPPAPPFNVLFVMSDQHHARALGHAGNGFGGAVGSLTPRLDQLAGEGLRFTQAHTSTPQCVPARYALLTGRWPHATGLRWNGVWEPRALETLPQLARRAGYATATIGKHHMAWLDQPEPRFEDHGFDLVLDLQDYFAFCSARGVPTWSAPGNRVTMPGLPGSLAKTGYSGSPNAYHPEGWFADQAIEFLRARGGPEGDGAPFVLWYLPEGPHTPLLPSGPADPQDFAHRFHPFDQLELPPNFAKLATTERLALLQDEFAGLDEEQWREVLSYYYGLVAQIDFNIGRVLDELDALGLAERTLVVYTSDHGEMGTEMACWTKGAGSYEAVSHVPLLMRLPGVIPAGGTRELLVSHLDLFPTLLELLGLPVEDPRRAALDGASLVEAALRPTPPPGWRDVLFDEFGPSPGARTRMARGPQDKYLLDEGFGGDEEYYLLSQDPWELEDRIASPADRSRIDELRARLAAWWDDEAGHAPIYRISGTPTAAPVPADGPSPRDQETGVATDVDPRWVPCTAAQVQRVWLGTRPDALALFAELGHMASSFNPGALPPSTTWYWRVDGENANGVAQGSLWRFTTAASGPAGPRLARAPSPPDGADPVARPVVLTWTPAPDASAQRLVLGPVGAAAPTLKGLAAGAGSYSPGPLLAGTTYQWRVDSISAAGTTIGDVWSFTTSLAGLPRRVEPRAPAHLDETVAASQGVELSWLPAPGAALYRVHLGTSFPLPLVAETSEPRWPTPPLEANRVHYWRVDARNADGTTLGWTWRFRARP